MKPYLIIVATIAIAVCVPASAFAKPDEPGTASTKAASSPVIDPLKMLPGPELTEEQESARGELESAVRTAKEAADQAAAHAALANWLLAVPTARPATRWLIGVATPEDRKAIGVGAQAALPHLTDASAQLKKASPSSGTDKTRVKKLTTNIKSLQAFAAAMTAVATEGNDAARRQAWSEAASALAESRESDDAALASAATLWQAIAWDQAGRRERALSTLPGALAKPDQALDFLARIVRCRILADAGEITAAIALTTQIRARVGEWYENESPARQRARQRLVGLLELEIGNRWAKKMASSTQPSNAETLDELLTDVQQRLFPKGDAPPTVYVLTEAIPILITPPAGKPAPADPDEKPASREATEKPASQPPATAPSEPEEPEPDQPKPGE